MSSDAVPETVADAAAPGRRRLPPPPVLGRRAAAWARDYAWIVAAQAGGALRPTDPASLAQGDGAPVVLLPGIYERWGVLGALARALHGAGHPVHMVPSLGRNAGALAWSTDQVVHRVLELDLTGVVLVAHSKGGLIGKMAMADPRVADRIAGLVAVNTPFGGSVYARWFPAAAVRALAPQDPHVVALGAVDEVNPRIVSVSAPFDPHVPAGHGLDGAHLVRLPVDGHFRVLGDARVHRVVLDAVQRLSA